MLTLLHISRSLTKDQISGKRIGVIISLNWDLLLSSEINLDEVDVGLPIKCEDKEFSHESYIRALANLLSKHDFEILEFYIADTLYIECLMNVLGLDSNNKTQYDYWFNRLQDLGGRWIAKHAEILSLLLPGRKILYTHWNELKENENFEAYKNKFLELKDQNKKIGGALNNEIDSFINRRKKTEKAIPARDYLMGYLIEEVTIIEDILLSTGRVKFFIYTHNMNTAQTKHKEDQIPGQWIIPKLAEVRIELLDLYLLYHDLMDCQYGIDQEMISAIISQQARQVNNNSLAILSTFALPSTKEEKEKCRQIAGKMMDSYEKMDQIRTFLLRLSHLPQLEPYQRLMLINVNIVNPLQQLDCNIADMNKYVNSTIVTPLLMNLSDNSENNNSNLFVPNK